MRIISTQEVEAVSGGIQTVTITGTRETSSGSTNPQGGGWIGPATSMCAPAAGESFSNNAWGFSGTWGGTSVCISESAKKPTEITATVGDTSKTVNVGGAVGCTIIGTSAGVVAATLTSELGPVSAVVGYAVKKGVTDYCNSSAGNVK